MTYFSDQFKSYREIKRNFHLIYEINSMFNEFWMCGISSPFFHPDDFSIKANLKAHDSFNDILIALELSIFNSSQRQNMAGSLFAYAAAGAK